MTYLNYTIKHCLVFLITATLASCCDPPLQPEYPGKVRGWISASENYEGNIAAILVMKKGEKSHNDLVEIEIVDIKPPEKPCATDSVGSLPRATVKFYSNRDHKAICEQTVYAPSTINVDCASSLGIYTIGVQAINTKDNWILFDLRGKLHRSQNSKE